MKKHATVPCLRVRDVAKPFVPSQKQKCAKCDTDLWVAETTYKALEKHGIDVKDAIFNCVICCELGPKDKITKFTKEQIDDVKKGIKDSMN